MSKQYYVYLMTNEHHSVIYTGVTRNLVKRVYQHKAKVVPSFTSQYNVTQLVYFEVFADPYSAISREKQIKAGSRDKKIRLIKSLNSNWKDLYNDL